MLSKNCCSKLIILPHFDLKFLPINDRGKIIIEGSVSIAGSSIPLTFDFHRCTTALLLVATDLPLSVVKSAGDRLNVFIADRTLAKMLLRKEIKVAFTPFVDNSTAIIGFAGKVGTISLKLIKQSYR